MVSDPNPVPKKLQPVPDALLARVQPAAIDDEITLRDLFIRVWRGKWIVFATMAVAVGLIVLWMKFSTPLYTASMVVTPAGQAEASGMGNRLSQFQGLASLAGIRLPPSQTVTSFAQFMELTTSVTMVQRLQEKHGVLQIVYYKSWDAENEQWVQPDGPVARAKGQVRAFFDLPIWMPPSAERLAKRLNDALDISEIPSSGMRKIAFRHKDPEFAAQFLRWLHEEADGLIREEAQERTTRQIKYIEEKLGTVVVAEHRLSLTQLLSDQEKQMMMIQVDLPYAARIIEPPIVPERPTSPKVIRNLLLGVVGGVILGVFIVLLVGVLRGGPAQARPS